MWYSKWQSRKQKIQIEICCVFLYYKCMYVFTKQISVKNKYEFILLCGVCVYMSVYNHFYYICFNILISQIYIF
jgi:hypothetical protein